jgi:Cys-tRNA(Pro)/Cys-tRNA(Cys) deacylase
MVDSPAIEAVQRLGVEHRVVQTVPATSAEESAQLQGIELGALLRTIVVRRGADDFLFVLVPGGRRFDWPKLRAHLGVSRLSMPDAEEAHAVTGYERGAITPFGAITPWPVLIDASAMEHPLVAIGGGMRGVNLHLAPADLVTYLAAEVVDVSVPDAADEP